MRPIFFCNPESGRGGCAGTGRVERGRGDQDGERSGPSSELGAYSTYHEPRLKNAFPRPLAPHPSRPRTKVGNIVFDRAPDALKEEHGSGWNRGSDRSTPPPATGKESCALRLHMRLFPSTTVPQKLSRSSQHAVKHLHAPCRATAAKGGWHILGHTYLHIAGNKSSRPASAGTYDRVSGQLAKALRHEPLRGDAAEIARTAKGGWQAPGHTYPRAAGNTLRRR